MSNSGLTLNLGSGKDRRDDCINADIRPDVGADWVIDISKLKWGEVVKKKEQYISIKPATFERIVAFDVLEHIQDLVKAMTNCRDLLTVGGEMHIVVPYELSLGAWQDPTHVRAFNENSWVYYCAWHWYLGWQGTRFEMTHLDLRLSEYGKTLELEEDELLRTPRAVDSMYVVLRKIPA
jgi:SAM-dependent methyltransferase